MFSTGHLASRVAKAAANASSQEAQSDKIIPGKSTVLHNDRLNNVDALQENEEIPVNDDPVVMDMDPIPLQNNAEQANNGNYHPIDGNPPPLDANEQEDQPNLPPNQADNPSTMQDPAYIRQYFSQYCEDSKRNRLWLEPEYEAAIALMQLLNVAGAPNSLFDSIMKWHIDHLSAKKRINKDKLYEKLRSRYNMNKTLPYEVQVQLPSSGVKALVPCHDVQHVFMDLLTDPQLDESDYLWFNNNPLAAPPDEWLYLADINSSLSYRMTYDKLIRPRPYTDSGRRRVIVPVFGYMDGCVTGNYENLSMEFFKITLGIFNSKARDKDYTWRILGAVPQYQKVKAKATEMIATSGHLDAEGYLTPSDWEDDDQILCKFRQDYDVEDYINSSDTSPVVGKSKRRM
jgi:hypothetical protein